MAMTRQQFVDWAKSKGWQEDNFGHLQKQTDGKQYRFKISSISIRYEVKVNYDATDYTKAHSDWLRLRSGYFKDLSITEDGKLSGLKR